MSGLHKVRVKQEPDVVREVDDAEYEHLKFQGLLVTTKGEPTAEVKAAAEKKETVR